MRLCVTGSKLNGGTYQAVTCEAPSPRTHLRSSTLGHGMTATDYLRWLIEADRGRSMGGGDSGGKTGRGTEWRLADHKASERR